MQIEQGTFWTYVGNGRPLSDDNPDMGLGATHKVIDVEAVHAANNYWITTWSVPLFKHITSDGWTWYGPVADFLKQFKPK